MQGDAARGLDVLENWDMRMDPQSAGAAVYAFFWQSLIEELFRDELPSLWNADALLESSYR